VWLDKGGSFSGRDGVGASLPTPGLLPDAGWGGCRVRLNPLMTLSPRVSYVQRWGSRYKRADAWLKKGGSFSGGRELGASLATPGMTTGCGGQELPIPPPPLYDPFLASLWRAEAGIEV
jgi:hypothetical protein